jgi:hypothetical protein
MFSSVFSRAVDWRVWPMVSDCGGFGMAEDPEDRALVLEAAHELPRTLESCAQGKASRSRI